MIWIDRRPGAVWTVGRTVNPHLGPVKLDDGLWQGYELDDALEAANSALEADMRVAIDDGRPVAIESFTRQELLGPLERWFFGRLRSER